MSFQVALMSLLMEVIASQMLMFLAFKQSAFFQFVQQIQKAIPA